MIGLRTSLYPFHILGCLAISLSLMSVSLLSISQAAQAQMPGGAGATSPGASGKPGAYTPNPRAVSLYNLGLTAHKQGSPESAIIFFKRACDIDPDLADAQYNLGVLYQMQKRFKEATPRFEEVLRIKPTDPDAHFQLGIIFQDTGRYGDSRQHLSSIAPNNPHFPEAQRRIAAMASLPAVDPNAAAMGAPPQQTQAQPQLQAPVQQQQSYQNVQNIPSAGTTPAYGSLPPTTTASGAPYGVSQDSTYNNAAQGGQNYPASNQTVVAQIPSQPSYKAQPATAYVPASAPVPPQASSGPIPVLSNSSLRVIATGFSAPSGLAFDRNGSLYVANYMTNSIDRISADGTRNTFCTGVNLRGPIGLVVDDSNNLYVANYNSGTVVRVSPAGISTVVASGFKKPYYLTLDKDGNLYVSQQEDNSIVRIVLPRALGARTP